VIIGAGNTARYTAPDAGFYQFRLTVTVDNIATSGPATVNFIFFAAGLGLPATPPPGNPLTAADNGNTYSYEVVANFSK
jgi:hypothetical protein